MSPNKPNCVLHAPSSFGELVLTRRRCISTTITTTTSTTVTSSLVGISAVGSLTVGDPVVGSCCNRRGLLTEPTTIAVESLQEQVRKRSTTRTRGERGWGGQWCCVVVSFNGRNRGRGTHAKGRQKTAPHSVYIMNITFCLPGTARGV